MNFLITGAAEFPGSSIFKIPRKDSDRKTMWLMAAGFHDIFPVELQDWT
jgi:hypothetical protein